MKHLLGRHENRSSAGVGEGDFFERRRWRNKREIRSGSGRKNQGKRKPEDFFGHRNRGTFSSAAPCYTEREQKSSKTDKWFVSPLGGRRGGLSRSDRGEWAGGRGGYRRWRNKQQPPAIVLYSPLGGWRGGRFRAPHPCYTERGRKGGKTDKWLVSPPRGKARGGVTK